MRDPLDTYRAASFQAERAAFLATHPDYDADAIAELRATEYGRLDATGSTYLDHTGAGLYAASQVTGHHEVLASGVFGNPHSHNPSALASTALVERARAAVLEHLNADPAEYDVIFTGNASGALKLVGEAFPFTPASTYVLLYDNHNSVNGIREYARRAGARVVYVPVRPPELRLDAELLEARAGCAVRSGVASAVRLPRAVELLRRAAPARVDSPRPRARLAHGARRGGVPAHQPPDLAEVKPDFLPISFYKLFGYPTGAGALVARHEALRELCRPWFAGGTITLASVQGEGWYRLAPGHAGFEDGTVDFLGLPAVTIGLEHLAHVGVERIHERVMAVADWLLGEMAAATHSNGAPLFTVFGPTDLTARGATIAFYLLDPTGAVFDCARIERLAGEERSPCARAASATRVTARSRTRSHATRWRRVSRSPRSRSRSRDCQRDHRRPHRQGAEHDPHLARHRRLTLARRGASCASWRGSGTGPPKDSRCAAPSCDRSRRASACAGGWTSA